MLEATGSMIEGQMMKASAGKALALLSHIYKSEESALDINIITIKFNIKLHQLRRWLPLRQALRLRFPSVVSNYAFKASYRSDSILQNVF